MISINIYRYRWLVLGVLLMAGGVACTTYYRDGAPIYRSTYDHDPYYYHYYPDSSVYFNISSGYYYYPDGDHWRRVRKLPSRYHLDDHDRVRLWIDADQPYARHRQHRERYRPDPHYRHDPKRDPEERRSNERLHERYRNR